MLCIKLKTNINTIVLIILYSHLLTHIMIRIIDIAFEMSVDLTKLINYLL